MKTQHREVVESFCLWTGVEYQPGELRSGRRQNGADLALHAAVSVVLAAMGLLTAGAVCRHESLSGTSWTAEATPSAHDLATLTTVAVAAEVHETGSHEFVVDTADPLTRGVLWL